MAEKGNKVLTPVEQKVYEHVSEAMEEVFECLDLLGSEEVVKQAILDKLSSSHRTIQQNFWRTIFDVAKEYGDTATFNDRNRGAVDACKAASKAVEKHPMPFI
tara:strand:+ start:1247 stop:1555 length:309 start_codon:yes stop_codon:yes gene_type:complete